MSLILILAQTTKENRAALSTFAKVDDAATRIFHGGAASFLPASYHFVPGRRSGLILARKSAPSYVMFAFRSRGRSKYDNVVWFVLIFSWKARSRPYRNWFSANFSQAFFSKNVQDDDDLQYLVVTCSYALLFACVDNILDILGRVQMLANVCEVFATVRSIYNAFLIFKTFICW